MIDLEYEGEVEATTTLQDAFATLWIGFSFFFLYSGYNALQTELPVERPTAGPLTIALSYLAYAAAALLAPAKTILLRRVVFGIAGITFALWIVSTNYEEDIFLAAMSILNGAGAGLLWTTEGVWLSSRNPQHTGRISAAILTLFHLATVAGQLAAEYTNVWLPSLVAACFGSLMLFSTPGHWLGPASEHEERQFRKLLYSEWHFLIPSIITFGLASSLIWVHMPTLLGDYLSWGFVIFAGVSVVLFPLTGLLADYTRFRWMFYGGAIVHSFLWGLLFITKQSPTQGLAYMAAAAVANTLLNQAIVRRQTQLGELANSAFAAQVSLYCLSYALGSAVIAYDASINIILTEIFAVLSMCLV